MHKFPAALTGANAYFAKKIQARRGNAQPTRNSNRHAGYITLQKDLESFYEAEELHLDLAELDEGEGIVETVLKHNAPWHKSCRVKYNAAKLKRLKRKRKPNSGKVSQQSHDSGERTRSDLFSTSVGQEVCFFCGGPAS